MAIFQTYDQKGKKLSFANWISNISPEDTPFVSATGKETIDQTKFSWQVDTLASATSDNAYVEGSDAGDYTGVPTTELSNQTQILRKVVIVSDTSNSTANYGRGRELMYQLEKAGAEIKRDLEKVLLQNGPAKIVSSSQTGTLPTTSGQAGARTTGGFEALVGRTQRGSAGSYTYDVNQTGHDGKAPDADFEQVVVKDVAYNGDAAAAAGTVGTISEAALFDLTQSLYIVGAKADTIMLHPRHAGAIASLQEAEHSGAATRVRYFQNTKSIDLEVTTITDPLGQTFKVVFNRFMKENRVFVFSNSDWTQMVLRAPMRTELAKTGSSQKWMIEMEVGLRHRNPYASGILNLLPKA